MSPENHLLLAETGPGTPMGELLRRYWTPALLSRELPEADGAPARVRLLGEDLVAFRDTRGRVGLLREFCSHRGASLYFGNNEDCGLRCWYHGWKYDIDGNCLDMPNEPPQSRFKEQVKHPAYPCIEKNGVVWTYLGPREKQQELPRLEWLTVPEENVYVSKRLQLCHWTQGMDGDLDSSHLGFLHGETIGRTVEHAPFASAAWMADDNTPKIEVVATPAGLLIGARRNAGPDTYYWRINQWFIPGFTTIPAFTGDSPLSGHAWVPIDEGRCHVYAFTWHPRRALSEGELSRMRAGSAVHSALMPGTFMPVANKDNDYAGPDAPPARQPWMRIRNFQDQDNAITESMGPLYDRTRERLGASDLAIIQTRRRLIDAAKRLAEGDEPPGMNAADYRLRPVSIELPRTGIPWPDAVSEAIAARPETFRASV
jgi:phenylpropionate dioxygenase-like ring-hydroxylating dioxygenase large terminal subunit